MKFLWYKRNDFVVYLFKEWKSTKANKFEIKSLNYYSKYNFDVWCCWNCICQRHLLLPSRKCFVCSMVHYSAFSWELWIQSSKWEFISATYKYIGWTTFMFFVSILNDLISLSVPHIQFNRNRLRSGRQVLMFTVQFILMEFLFSILFDNPSAIMREIDSNKCHFSLSRKWIRTTRTQFYWNQFIYTETNCDIWSFLLTRYEWESSKWKFSWVQQAERYLLSKLVVVLNIKINSYHTIQTSKIILNVIVPGV